MRFPILLLCLAVLSLLPSGCRRPVLSKKSTYETITADPKRDRPAAIAGNERAEHLVKKGKLLLAEKALQGALISDVTYGPAHNNLGEVYLRQHKYYLAAWEFQYASRLMPTRWEPHYNLGLLFEEAAQPDRAVIHYDNAYQLAPENAQILGSLVRTRLGLDPKDMEAERLLHELIMHDNRPEWVRWAEEQLAVGKFPKRVVEAGEFSVSAKNGADARAPVVNVEELPRGGENSLDPDVSRPLLDFYRDIPGAAGNPETEN